MKKMLLIRYPGRGLFYMEGLRETSLRRQTIIKDLETLRSHLGNRVAGTSACLLQIPPSSDAFLGSSYLVSQFFEAQPKTC